MPPTPRPHRRRLCWLKIWTVMVVCTFAMSSNLSVAVAQQSPQHQIKVSLGPAVTKTPVSGRVMVFFSTQATPAPRHGPDWFSPEPFYGTDAVAIQPGGAITVDDAANGFPAKLSAIKPGHYFVQAVLDRDFYFADHNDGPGNLYSSVKETTVETGRAVNIELTLDSVVGEKKYRETDLARVFTYNSALLSASHKRAVQDRALVLLPRNYHNEPNRRYPVYYEVTGFGATIDDLIGRQRRSNVSADGVEFIHVMLTGQCKWGHHVYADSAANGPRSQALTTELIPEIDRQFRTVASSGARFVGGHSSGGWSSLWLQVQHPDVFGGCWSTAPDPVDFRDFQGTDLYAPDANILFNADRSRKPLARSGGRTIVWYQDFLKMDDTLGRGGQLRSFEAVFSPLGTDGLPQKCWNRQTGAINPDVAAAWKKYDIGDHLETHWENLRGPLARKINVFMGTKDTFYLNRSAQMLAQRMQTLGSDAQFEFFEGRNHFNLIDRGLRNRIHTEMADAYRRSNP